MITCQRHIHLFLEVVSSLTLETTNLCLSRFCCGGANGTFVNGRRIKQVCLTEGDIIGLGHGHEVAEGGELEGEALVYKIAVKLCEQPQSEGVAAESRDLCEVAAGGEGDARGEVLTTPGPTRQHLNTPQGRDAEGAREREWRDALIAESRRREEELLRTQELLGRARNELERARGDVNAMRAAHEEALGGAKGRNEELEEALRRLRGDLEEEAARGRSSREEVLRIEKEMRLLEEELRRARSEKEEEVLRLTRAGEAVAESRSQLCDDLRVMEQVKTLHAHFCWKRIKANQKINQSIDP